MKTLLDYEGASGFKHFVVPNKRICECPTEKISMKTDFALSKFLSSKSSIKVIDQRKSKKLPSLKGVYNIKLFD